MSKKHASIELQLNAVDRITAPTRRAVEATKHMTAAMRQQGQQVSELSAQRTQLSSYHKQYQAGQAAIKNYSNRLSEARKCNQS